MTNKRHETKPFAADTIQILPYATEPSQQDSTIATVPHPDDEGDTVWEANNRPSTFEEVLSPDDDKKGRTKWIR